MEVWKRDELRIRETSRRRDWEREREKQRKIEIGSDRKRGGEGDREREGEREIEKERGRGGEGDWEREVRERERERERISWNNRDCLRVIKDMSFILSVTAMYATAVSVESMTREVEKVLGTSVRSLQLYRSPFLPRVCKALMRVNLWHPPDRRRKNVMKREKLNSVQKGGKKERR